MNAVEKQETDKIGDIDNISKPIQDALIGPNGIIIDDAQIGGLYTSWLSRNEMIVDNILRIDIRFNNDNVLIKKNLKFIQYNAAICMPINIDASDVKSLFAAKLIIHARNKIRNSALIMKKMGANGDRYLICSDWDYHKSRLNAFDKKDILTLQELNKLCLKRGLSFKKIIELMKKPSANKELS